MTVSCFVHLTLMFFFFFFFFFFGGGGGGGAEVFASAIVEVWRFLPSLLANQIHRQKPRSQQLFFFPKLPFKVTAVVFQILFNGQGHIITSPQHCHLREFGVVVWLQNMY